MVRGEEDLLNLLGARREDREDSDQHDERDGRDRRGERAVACEQASPAARGDERRVVRDQIVVGRAGPT